MSIDLTTDLDQFNSFVSERLADFGELTLEEGLIRFRKYQRELTTAQEKLREAEDQSSRGESGPLDVDSLKSNVRKRLSADGITE